jgi:hypothetical protein
MRGLMSFRRGRLARAIPGLGNYNHKQKISVLMWLNRIQRS